MLGAFAAGALMVGLGPVGAAGADATAPDAALVHPAIVGGSPIFVTEAPWQVKVEEIIPVAGQPQPEVFVCGGSILSETKVLTAAHCVFNESKQVPPGDLQIIAGTSNYKAVEDEVEELGVSAVRVHPDYVPNPGAMEDIPDDVAVLTLEKALKFGPGINKIALAPAGSILPEGMLVNIAGFGEEIPHTELSGRLNALTMNLVSSRACGGMADAVFVCARTQKGSVCFGDSGSGLTIPGSPATPGVQATPVMLIGVTNTVEEECADNALAGFANVTAPEIQDFIEGNENPPPAPRGGGSAIIGTAEVGQSLTCDPGTWTGDPTPTFTYLFINGVNNQILEMGSSTTYLVSGSDVGSTVLCEVRAANAGGTGIVRTGAMRPIKAAQPPPVTSPAPVTVTPAGSLTVATAPAAGGTGTVPPSGNTTPAVAGGSNVSLVGTTVAVEASGKASVKVACRGSAACHGKLTLTAKSSVEVKGKQTVRTVPIGTASFSIPGGGSRTVQIKLGPVGRGLLVTGHGRLSARLAIVKLAPAPRQSQVKTVQLVAQKGPRGTK